MPPKTDMVTLARLHAALDAVVETQALLAEVGEDATIKPGAVSRANALVGEARELLRALLRREVDTVSVPHAVSTR